MLTLCIANGAIRGIYPMQFIAKLRYGDTNVRRSFTALWHIASGAVLYIFLQDKLPREFDDPNFLFMEILLPSFRID